MHPGSPAARHSGFIQTLLQILRGHEFRRSSETLVQRSPLAAHSQRAGERPQENQDAAVWVGCFHIRPKERHGCNDGRWGHVREGGSGGEASAAASASHPQAYFHAPRQAFERAAVHLLARQGAAAHGCRYCYWWVIYLLVKKHYLFLFFFLYIFLSYIIHIFFFKSVNFECNNLLFDYS